MGSELYFLLAASFLLGFVLWMVELPLQYAAKRKARPEFRRKGFVKPPSGFGWFPFLLQKHYVLFKDANVRNSFAVCRICMIGIILCFSIPLLLVILALLFEAVGLAL